MKKLVFAAVIMGIIFSATYFYYDYTRTYELIINTDEDSYVFTLRHNEVIPNIEIPQKEGYLFAGWYTDHARTEPFLNTTMPKYNVSLYPDWGSEGLHFLKVGNNYTVFSGTSSANHIVIPKRHQGSLITSIGYQAFTHRETLEMITIPNTIETIEARAFFLTSHLTEVIFEADSVLRVIGDNAFSYSKIQQFHVPKSVEVIGSEAFLVNDALTVFRLEEDSQLQSIGVRAFYGSENLMSILIPETVTSIGSQAFSFCLNLTTVTISPNSVLESIGNYAFSYTILNEIYLPNHVHTIGEYAFYNTRLIALYIPLSVETIGQRAIVSSQSFLFTSIYVVTDSKPENWANNWNSESYNVVWGAPSRDE